MTNHAHRSGRRLSGHRTPAAGSRRRREGAAASPAAAPDFVARAPWWGGDLQTLHNLLLRNLSDRFAAPLPAGGERLRIPMEDGSNDALLALLDRPGDGPARPLVVLIHGLTGCEDSLYMRSSAAYFLSLGYPVLRLNLRGAGPARSFCRFRYHAGRSEDLRTVLRWLGPLGRHGILLIAYSLGANMMLKYLGEETPEAPVLAAASVSAPIDLAVTSARMLASRNRFYHAYLLASLKEDTLYGGAETRPAERAAIREARTIYEFDEVYVAPRNGFAGADDYYERCAAKRFLAGVRTPTLLIHARDDPWIPAWTYRRMDWRANPNLRLLLAAGGGHVGFHARGDPVPWSDRRVAGFFAEVS